MPSHSGWIAYAPLRRGTPLHEADGDGGDRDRVQRVIDDIRRLTVEHNVFRGHVIEFGSEVFGHRQAPFHFVDRPHIDREHVILPPEVLGGIERQVIGVARHAGRLLASGQHLKRGVLLHGAPRTGKTHMIRYLLGQRAGDRGDPQAASA
jgi:hypothetical protein